MYKVKELDESKVHSILDSLCLIESNQTQTIITDRFESKKYYPVSLSDDYFTVFESIYPSLVISSVNQSNFASKFITPQMNSTFYSEYSKQIEKNLKIKIWPYDKALNFCKENHFDLFKLQSATVNQDTLLTVRDVSFFYDGQSGPVFRTMSFLEKYQIKQDNDSILTKRTQSCIIIPEVVDSITYALFYYEPFSIINNIPYCLFRNYNEKKPFQNELIGARFGLDESGHINYTDLVKSDRVNASDSLSTLLKLHLYGNGAKLFKFKNKFYILYFYLNKVVSLNDHTVTGIEDWIRANINPNFKDKINLVKDIYINGDKISILVLTKSIQLRYLENNSGHIKVDTLLSDDYDSNYRINATKILSFSINDQHILVNSFQLR